MKKFLLPLIAAMLSVVVLFCGCFEGEPGQDGRDGKDGQNLTIQSAYDKYVEEYGQISFEEFLYKFFSYSNEELDNMTGVQAAVNKSLMSGVSILTRFTYSKSSQNSLGFQSTHKSYKVYTGSGAIIWLDKAAGDAYVVTNCHVVYDDSSDEIVAKDVRLYLYGQDESGSNYVIDKNTNNILGDENFKIDAQVIGASVTYDIALLKVAGSEVIKKSDAVAASFSQEADVFAGEFVYAIGNASGEGMSASDGRISKDSEYIQVGLSDLDKTDVNEYRVLRTTAPINHGNSGGGLFNTRGEIVAVVNAKDEGEDIDNMGYALPASGVRRLLKLMYEQYTQNGEKFSGNGISKAYLNVSTTVADSYSVYDAEKGRAVITEAVKVAEVTNRPAKDKLQVNDLIKHIKITDAAGTVKEDMPVTRRYHVQDCMFSVRKNDRVILTVERGGAEIEVQIDFTSNGYFSNVR